MEELLIQLGLNLASESVKESIKGVINCIFKENSDLNKRTSEALNAKSEKLLNEVASDILNEIKIAAKSGKVSIDGAVLDALNKISINHQNGLIEINNTTISSDTLVTGGLSANSSGTTIVGGNTTL